MNQDIKNFVNYYFEFDANFKRISQISLEYDRLLVSDSIKIGENVIATLKYLIENNITSIDVSISIKIIENVQNELTKIMCNITRNKLGIKLTDNNCSEELDDFRTSSDKFNRYYELCQKNPESPKPNNHEISFTTILDLLHLNFIKDIIMEKIKNNYLIKNKLYFLFNVKILISILISIAVVSGWWWNGVIKIFTYLSKGISLFLNML